MEVVLYKVPKKRMDRSLEGKLARLEQLVRPLRVHCVVQLGVGPSRLLIASHALLTQVPRSAFFVRPHVEEAPV